MADKKPLTFDDFRLAGQDDHSFHVEHPDGSTFKVAKAAIDEPMAASIAAMPTTATQPDPDVIAPFVDAEIAKNRVPVYDPVTGTSRPGQLHPLVEQGIRDRIAKQFQDYQAAIADPLHTSPMVLDSLKSRFGTPPLKPALAGVPGSVEVIPPGTPSPDGTIKPGQQVSEGDVGIGAPGKPAVAGATPALTPAETESNKAYAMMQRGIQDNARAQEEAAKAQADAYQAQQDQLAKAQEQYAAHRAELDKQNNVLYEQVMNGKVQPGKLMGNMSTGNKILAGIAIALGGIGQGLQGPGAKNAAMETLQTAIDRDIDAQKADLEKKKGLLAQNLARVRDLGEAEAMTRSQIMAMTAAQIEQAKAKASGPAARATADQMLGQLKLAMAKENEAVAQRRLLRDLTRPQPGVQQPYVNPEDLRLMGDQGKDLADRQVTLPNGQQRYVTNKEDVKELKDKIATVEPIMKGLDRLESLGADAMVNPAKREEAGKILLGLTVLLKKNTELNRIFSSTGKEGDGFNLMKMIENPTEFRSLLTGGRNDALRNYISDTLAAEFKSKLSGGYNQYRPRTEQKFAAIAPKEK